MAVTPDEQTGSRRPLRLWPCAVAAAVQFLAVVIAIVVPATFVFAMIATLAAGLAIIVWWLLFSRAPWPDRIGAIVLMVAAVFATLPVLHESIANAGQGMLFPIMSVPVMTFGLAAWAVAAGRLSAGLRRVTMAAAILLACSVFALLRTGGVTGDGRSDFHWRWTPTAEDRLLARSGSDAALPPASATLISETRPAEIATSAATPMPTPTTTATESATPTKAASPVRWPGFRGPDRDGVVRGVRIETDWSTSPPAELWRRPIGPGWSSFAAGGDLLYTQEQRGEQEIVACYRMTTGEPVWQHSDPVRFWESNGGAGPRATPTLADGRVYTFGATGIVNALDAHSGAVVWSRNAASDTSTKVPVWGFASSPLIVDDIVVVAAAGNLVGYDIATGEPRWFGPKDGGSYSSPHLVTIDDVAQILQLSTAGATSVVPADGTVLWTHEWSGGVIVQPAITADGDILINSIVATGGLGIRRLAVERGAGGWTVQERWTSGGLKPYFNDFVLYKGHAFGFDGTILSCIDLADGKRKWKGGRYGAGQLVLLADQDLLLVLSEEGELALVKASPDGFSELSRFPALEGKTWNHPVLVGDVLLVRNGEEMAAFRLKVGQR